MKDLPNTYNFTCNNRDATLIAGGMLGIAAFWNDATLPTVSVLSAELSDHHLLLWNLPLSLPRSVYVFSTSLAWSKFDPSAFIRERALSPLCKPESWATMDVNEKADLYCTTTRSVHC